MQNLISKDGQKRGRAAKQHGKKIERDCGENDVFAENKLDSRYKAVPGAGFCVITFARRARDREHEKEKRKGGDRVDSVNTRETRVRDKETANSRADDGADLKDAAVPSDRVRERIARNECREKRTARSPTEGARDRADEEQ